MSVADDDDLSNNPPGVGAYNRFVTVAALTVKVCRGRQGLFKGSFRPNSLPLAFRHVGFSLEASATSDQELGRAA
jgi:hypothetical protein